jgi:carbonic anhydrase
MTKRSAVFDEVVSANKDYAGDFGDKGKLALPPARRFAILTCMDARLDPAKYAGLAEGDAHVIRNAGGRASDDAIRSLVISHKLLGTREWFVVHHTDCGMQLFTTKSSGISLKMILAPRNSTARSGLIQNMTAAPLPDISFIGIPLRTTRRASLRTCSGFELTHSLPRPSRFTDSFTT